MLDGRDTRARMLERSRRLCSSAPARLRIATRRAAKSHELRRYSGMPCSCTILAETQAVREIVNGPIYGVNRRQIAPLVVARGSNAPGYFFLLRTVAPHLHILPGECGYGVGGSTYHHPLTSLGVQILWYCARDYG